MRSRNIVLNVFVFLLFAFLTASICQAEQSIPLPDDAVATISKDTTIGPVTASIRGYTTGLSKEGLASFYKKFFKTEGWAEKRELYFLKGDRYISVSVLPKKPKEAIINFVITEGRLPSQQERNATKKDIPDKLSFMPVYPQAKQMYLWDMPIGLVAGYSTESSIQDVVFFYKAGMLNFGWELYNETPVRQGKVDCPECEKAKKNAPPGGSSFAIGGTSYNARLAYKRGEGEVCIINLHGFAPNDSQSSKVEKGLTDQEAAIQQQMTPIPPMNSQTQITVNYSANKQTRP